MHLSGNRCATNGGCHVTWYELFLFLHISMAVVWVGGGFFNQMLALRILGTQGRGAHCRVRRRHRGPGDADLRAFLARPASDGDRPCPQRQLGLERAVHRVGLLVWLVSFVAGIAYLGPTSGKIKTEMQAGGATPRAQALIGNVLRYSRIELVLLWIVVFMMVVKLPCGRRRL